MKLPTGADKVPTVDAIYKLIQQLSIASTPDGFSDIFESTGGLQKEIQGLHGVLLQAMKKSTASAEESEQVKVQHQQLFVHLHRKLIPGMDEYECFTAILGAYLREGELALCRNMLEILRKLETKGIISPGNYGKLIEIMNAAELVELATTVKNFANKIQTEIKNWNRTNSKEKTWLESENVTLTIQPMTGMLVTMKVDEMTTVQTVMKKYEDQTGVEPKYQMLIHKGKVMTADKKISDYKIKTGDIIQKCQRAIGG